MGDWSSGIEWSDWVSAKQLVEGALVALAAVIYHMFTDWARQKLILAPFVAGLQSDLATEADVLERFDADNTGSLRERLADAEAELSTDTSLWSGATIYAALMARHEARKLTAGLGDDSVVVARARLVSKLLPPDQAWLAVMLDEVADKHGRLTTGDREIVGHAVWQLSPDQAGATQTQLTLHRKSHWLINVGLSLIVIIVFSFGNAGIVALGALGAFVSRISTFVREKATDDLAFHWTTIMLSPVVGALAALPGVLLVDVLHTWDVIGPVFAGVRWGALTVPTLTVAFLSGFSERFLDSMVATATNTIESTPAPPAVGQDGGQDAAGGDHVPPPREPTEPTPPADHGITRGQATVESAQGDDAGGDVPG